MRGSLTDEAWIDAGSGFRHPSRMLAFGAPRPPTAEGRRAVVQAARAAAPSSSPVRVVVGGGEPTLSPDLPALVAELRAAVGDGWSLATHGLALVSEAALRPLADAGLPSLRLRVASFRPDAAAWWMQTPGAAKRATAALRAAAVLGLRTEVQVELIRPTADHLAETVAVAARLGAAAVIAVWRGPRWFAGDDQVALTARLGLLAAPLRAAEAEAEAAGIAFGVARLPHDVRIPGIPLVAVHGEDLGVPDRYVELFGRSELPSPPAADPAVEPLTGTSRAIRQRLVRHSGRARRLRITSVAHPDAAELLREALRLEFAEVEVVGDLTPLAGFSDDELHRIRRLDRLRPTAPLPRPILDRLARIAPEIENEIENENENENERRLGGAP